MESCRLATSIYTHMLRPVLRFRKPTERERDWLAVIPVCVLYFLLGKLMQDERAFLAAVSSGVFYVIISREWGRRRESRFWVTLSLFALVHVLALAVVKLPHFTGPSIAVAFPFMVADGFAMWAILNWTEKRFGTRRT